MDEPGRPVVPSVNLFVKVTNGCNARCKFCSNNVKLMDVIQKKKKKSICVNRLNITGGEPSIVSSLVQDIIETMHQENFDNIHLHLNTNGLLSQSQELMRHPRWDSISMSLHHYDVEMLSELTEKFSNVHIHTWNSLIVDYAVKNNANVLLRGIRNATDFAYEFDLSLINHSLNSKIDTVFIPCEQKYVTIKSSSIKELARFGGDISQMVPDLVAEKLREKFLG